VSYKSILVNIDIDRPIAPIVNASVDLASRHKAKLIGLCGADAPLPVTGPEGGALAAEVWQQMRDDIDKRLKELHAEFDKLTFGFVESNWRQDLTNPSHAAVTACRSADLIVMAASEGASTGDPYRIADPASVVLRAGRPLLVVAREAERMLAKKIVVAWKDTREARRAVADSLPLLAAAEEVSVVTVAAEADQLASDSLVDVVAFLATHGVKARQELIENPDEYVGLFEFIDTAGADLIVSGAYGHSRLREWAFGGITRSLLDKTGRNRFMSS